MWQFSQGTASGPCGLRVVLFCCGSEISCAPTEIASAELRFAPGKTSKAQRTSWRTVAVTLPLLRNWARGRKKGRNSRHYCETEEQGQLYQCTDFGHHVDCKKIAGNSSPKQRNFATTVERSSKSRHSRYQFLVNGRLLRNGRSTNSTGSNLTS